MVICLFGVSCTGKSTVSKALKEKINAIVYNGKDYLKLAKSPSDALILFKKELNSHLENIIFVTSEVDDLKLLNDSTLKVLFVASLDTIKSRFKQRLNGILPLPVERMLEKKYEMFLNEQYDILINTDESSVEKIVDKIIANIK